MAMLSNLVRATRSLSLSLLGAGILATSLPIQAQTSAKASSALPLITQQVDDSVRTTLHGNVSPLARAVNDRGAADASLQAPRMQLLLKRPADREAALEQYIVDIHNKNSASYHKWLTPAQIAQQYGPADSDVQAVVAWIQSQGLTVNKISRSKSVIEFGGNVGQIQAAFGTQIRKYVVNGETHYGNNSDPKIPSALAPAVKGVVRLNDFRPRSQAKLLGSATYSPTTHRAKAQWNYPEGSNGEIFLVGPGDFAVQYDTAPLTTAGTTGTGITIGIIQDSNIDLTLVNAFRTLFSLPANTPQVIVDGTDPGINGDSVEAYLDVEWSGAVAPAATIDMYTAAGTVLGGGLDLAAARAVDDDSAQVLSLSFGGCEQEDGLTENHYYASLWEQAAAQGQTVMVSTGDSGSEGCYVAGGSPLIYGLAVNALASTPYNVAVGGTDFYYSDYASSGSTGLPPSFGNYWSNPGATTTTPATTITATIPEQPWNDSQYGFNIAAYDSGESLTDFYSGETPVGGGGGASSCADQTDNNDGSITCISGYAKPAYQSALTPADAVRDLPDVSLFAANGINYSATPVCAEPGDCNTDGQSAPAGSGVTLTALGGTSVAAPSFAGIMALVDQKYGAQGQANFVLYPLFSQFPAAFHDVTAGSNNEPCDPSSSELITTCGEDTTGGTFSVQDYSAATGYDQASGLGTVDANVLVADWNKVTFSSTTTSLALSSATITHGSTETLTATVTGATSGDVSFVPSAAGLNNKGANTYNASTSTSNFATVGSNGVATLATTNLAGGTYTITAQYSGNGSAATSASTPQNITVNPEASNVNLIGVETDYTGTTLNYPAFVVNGSTYPYGTEITADIQPVGTSVTQPSGAAPGTGTLLTDGIATGSATFTDNGGGGSSTVALNAQGFAEWSTGNFGVGSHSISASYSGDSSFNASTSSTPVTFTIAKGTPFLAVQPSVTSQQTGSNLTVQVVLYYLGTGAAPTGTVTVGVGTQTQTATLAPFFSGGNYSAATVVFSSVPTATSITASYSGDGNWNALPAQSTSFSSTTGTLIASTTALAVPPTTGANDATTVTLTATVSGSGAGPTGTVTFYTNSVAVAQAALSGGSPSTASATILGGDSYGGPNQFVAVYSGNTTYAASSSAASTASIDQSDFTLAAQNQVVSVAAGGSGTATVNLGSLNGFDANVALSCASATSTITCSISPTTVMVNGSATAAVTINVASGSAKNDSKPFWFAGGAAALACVLFFGIPARRRSWRTMLGLLLFGVMIAGNGCGGGSSSGGGSTTVATPTFSPAGGTYTSKQSVSISDSTSGATIYYTTDGSTPTTSSTKYSAAITVASSETLSAIATASGDTNSAVGTAAYKIGGTGVGNSTTIPPANTVVITATSQGANTTIHNVAIQVVTQ
jgi:hypothetical protein